MALTFCMGKDLQGILLSPIQQPMAMVSKTFHLKTYPHKVVDSIQFFWSAGNACHLGFRGSCSVHPFSLIPMEIDR